MLLWSAPAWAAHDLNVRVPLNPDHVCLTAEASIQIIGISSVSNVAVTDLLGQLRFVGECRYFAHGLGFWPDEVMAVLQWGPAHRSQVMYVMRGHEAHGMTVYTWATAAQARKLGIRNI